ncbi:translocator protein, LysE family [Verrucomicrobiia bacterium DG1235]|nr:translocator protein, LysE family [Verrucomicrobiae bacterium DG1235]
MTLESAIAFSLAMTLYSLSPGPGIAATIAKAVHSGFGAAMALLTGLIIGDALYLVAGVSGLAALALSFEKALIFVRLASGAYLVYLGWTTWRDAAIPLSENPRQASKFSSSSSTLKTIALGIGMTFGNPKVVLFYVGIMPSFLELENMTVYDTLAALIILIVVSYLTFGACALLAIKATRRAGNNRWSKYARRAAGLALALAGILIASEDLI